MKLEEKISIVENILKGKKVAIGFSGGADSTLIAYLSSKFAKDTLAITIDNHILPTDFIENAKKATESFGIRHEIIDINFYEDDKFLSNDSSRCYACRDLMYTQIEQLAKKRGFDFICDGNNISDLVIDRPGILITYKKGFKTPFIDAKLTSKEIHEYLNKNNISYSRSTTCLATRIPTDTPTTYEKIKRISYCEDYILANTDCEIVKVRDNGKFGIIEVDNLDEIIKENKYNQINDELKRQGFKKVALDLSQIDDDEYIAIDYDNSSFSYKLPYTINLENTKKQLGNKILSESKDKIDLEKISIYENGLIEGHDLESYEIALDTFMEILPRLRRNI
ncbi:ATP-dependent sacrificial sulfur transferase LarE [Methanobrevibacter sp.]|uniref:ATP-dependent sacrificial sulfur transferase LarE n=1 Tax=Methanobrevibacter sp. TaxID=66852 RepID=UPI002E7A86D4|nr:ATP-dependent sacrificial sulfur transferase LarE [Methanobrevibacter sp.]MEE0938653.1 ATP-dependent sacrificial sulfur transferase LarE [Methanobrevibacter sp.]